MSSVLKGTALFSALLAVTPAQALTQSWNGYHWARTGPLVIGLGDNVGSVWDPYLRTAATKWSTAKNIDFTVMTGSSLPSACNPIYGGVQVCNGNYGKTGWLGYATVWTAGGFIVQATVKMNDYYFSQPNYNTSAWRTLTMCQEIGHTLGLAHTNTITTNKNTGSCMDYTNDPSGKAGTNGTLANLAPNKVDLAALKGIYATVNKTQLPYTRPTYWAGEGYSIDGVEVDTGGSMVPEPAAWMMLITGFGLIGSTMRRRRTMQTA
ncbi:PEPxxWA-CTERM sorting domain-containing protein [Glacieibacterium sp.]|uniref:PEPxxWA-CTERM sorting domain-containing protein n=1 Tax=Glacieibacterium sp. TaxID=2860237 RepID=UPI003AFF6628